MEGLQGAGELVQVLLENQDRQSATDCLPLIHRITEWGPANATHSLFGQGGRAQLLELLHNYSS